ncbi:hypothetical protein FRB96_001818 [Tulasnella sp. 330]
MGLWPHGRTPSPITPAAGNSEFPTNLPLETFPEPLRPNAGEDEDEAGDQDDINLFETMDIDDAESQNSLQR